MIFFKNLKLFPFLYFVKINLEKVFANVQDRYKSFPGYKKDRLFLKKAYNYSVFLFSFVAHIGSVYDHSKLNRLIVILSTACCLSCGIKAIDRYSRRILTIK